MTAVFLLGPSKWAQGHATRALPLWLQEHQPGKEPHSPLDIRKALAARLGEDGHRIAVMEAFPDVPGRPKSQKFARIVEDQGIGRFVLYWPFGANRSGLDVEIGFVLERLRRKEVLGEDVRVLIEDDGVKRRAGGREIGPDGAFGFVSLEEGERTWYYDDLLLYRALIPFWADFDELLELLENIASD